MGDPLTITANGETLTVREWARRTGIAPHTIYRRLGRGWSPEAAVTTPSKRPDIPQAGEGERVTIAGETRTIYEWARASGLDASTIHARVDSGVPEHEILSPPSPPGERREITHPRTGVTRSLVEWAEEIGIDASTLYSRIDVRGWDLARALDTPRLEGGPTAESMEITREMVRLKDRGMTQVAIAERYGVTHQAVSRRIRAWRARQRRSE